MPRYWWLRPARTRYAGAAGAARRAVVLAAGKIIVLEPRRIAARASAERMAQTLGERVGETVGYRVRFGSKVSRATRIEVVTEGIFSREILENPELTGIAAVLFDEFHERSLDADLGLALARDAQTGLREDLRILVMSATLDGARVARLLGDLPVIASEGRAFPVETRYLGRKTDVPLERQMADAIAMALRADPGSVLAFGPGAAEICLHTDFCSAGESWTRPWKSCRSTGRWNSPCRIARSRRRRAATAKWCSRHPSPKTSLTIEGVCIVVDFGMARVPRYGSQSARRGSNWCGPRARPSISAAAVPVAPSRASAIGCGTNRRPLRLRPIRSRKY